MTVKEFNASYDDSIGKASLNAKYKDEKGNEVSAEVRFPAEILESKEAVFYVKGDYNAIPLINLLDLYQIPHENGEPSNTDHQNTTGVGRSGL